jgi:hypothetical protein
MPNAGSGRDRADARDFSDSSHDCPSIWWPRRPQAALLAETDPAPRARIPSPKLVTLDAKIETIPGLMCPGRNLRGG